MDSTLNRWIRYHLQLSEFIIIADSAVEHMKKPLYHFARLGYVVDYIQPIDTSPHRNELLAIFKMRFVEEQRKSFDQEQWLQIEAGNSFEGRLLRERQKYEALTEGDMQKNKEILSIGPCDASSETAESLSNPEGGIARQQLLAGNSGVEKKSHSQTEQLRLGDGAEPEGDPLWKILERKKRNEKLDN